MTPRPRIPSPAFVHFANALCRRSPLFITVTVALAFVPLLWKATVTWAIRAARILPALKLPRARV